MKRLWIAVALLAALLALSLFNAFQINALTEQLIERLEQAQSQAQVGQWSQARALTSQAYRKWQNSHFYLHTTACHSDTDEILRTFRSVLQYLALEEMDKYAAANADLITKIHLLAETEQASLTNVL